MCTKFMELAMYFSSNHRELLLEGLQCLLPQNSTLHHAPAITQCHIGSFHSVRNQQLWVILGFVRRPNVIDTG